MNIWFLSTYASPPNFSKISSRIFSLAKEMKELGHDVTIITSDSNHFTKFPSSRSVYNYETNDVVPFYWIRTLKYTKTASLARVLSWFDFEFKLFFFRKSKLPKPDVVIVSSLSILTIVYGWYIKKKYGAYLVFEIRDIWPLTMTEEGGFSKYNPLVLFIGLIELFGYKKSDLIVGTMPKLNLHVKNIIGFEKPFMCSPLGFDFHKYVGINDKVSSDLIKSFPSNKVIVGYAGSMGITNALEPFIEAIKLMNANENIHFMVVGSGDLKAKFIEILSGSKNVTFIDRIEQGEVKYFLEGCDILYLSTKKSKVWDYGQSMNKVLEYMLAAKPIIASYSGFPSMINEAECGVFIDNHDPESIKNEILKLALLSSHERKYIGEKGRKWALQNRSYSLLAKKYLEGIKEHLK